MWLRSFLKSLKSRPSVATFRHSHRSRSPQLRVEALDDRCLPSTFTVTNLLDSAPGSLRAAVTAAARGLALLPGPGEGGSDTSDPIAVRNHRPRRPRRRPG